MTAKDLMSRPAITCDVNDTLDRAAKLMWDHDCGAIPVTRGDDNRLVGVVTDRDICMAALTQGRRLDQILVNAAMAHDPVVATPETTAGEIEQLMADHQVRRIPIVDERGAPIGVVSLNDLAIESVQPDTKMKHGISKVAHTLAAICRPRTPGKQAA
jgi:CBS domain-containing protein